MCRTKLIQLQILNTSLITSHSQCPTLQFHECWIKSSQPLQLRGTTKTTFRLFAPPGVEKKKGKGLVNWKSCDLRCWKTTSWSEPIPCCQSQPTNRRVLYSHIIARNDQIRCWIKFKWRITHQIVKWPITKIRTNMWTRRSSENRWIVELKPKQEFAYLRRRLNEIKQRTDQHLVRCLHRENFWSHLRDSPISDTE